MNTNAKQATHFLPLVEDDFPQALEIMKEHDQKSYENLNKILENARTTGIKSMMVIQKMK